MFPQHWCTLSTIHSPETTPLQKNTLNNHGIPTECEFCVCKRLGKGLRSAYVTPAPLERLLLSLDAYR